MQDIKEDQHTHIPVEDYYRAMNTINENLIDPYIADSDKKPRWGGFSFPMSSTFNKKEEPNELKESVIDDGDNDEYISAAEKEAQRRWKEDNPNETIKEWRRNHTSGRVDELPWNHPDYREDYRNQLGLEADNAPSGTTGEVKGFGIGTVVDG
jgi:hypothetical protein